LKDIDAGKLFDMLKIAQIKDFDPSRVQELAASYSKMVPMLNYGNGFHMNSF